MTNKIKKPFGQIQWKGTDVCIDIHCLCGKSTHFDGDFMYFIKCPYCNRVYECDQNINLKEKQSPLIKSEKNLLQIAAKSMFD